MFFFTTFAFSFNRGVKAAKAACEIFTAHGDGAIPQSTACHASKMKF